MHALREGRYELQRREVVALDVAPVRLELRVRPPAITSVSPSCVGAAAKPRRGRTYVSNRPPVGRPLQYV
jgi:hypothetical protein